MFKKPQKVKKLLDEKWFLKLYFVALDIKIIRSLRPRNSINQKKLFLNNQIKNPIFNYYHHDNRRKIEYLRKIKKQIFFEEKNKLIKQLYLDKIDEMILELKLISNIGHNPEKFFKIGKKLFGEVKEKDFQNALKKFDSKNLFHYQGDINSQKIKDTFEKSLKKFGLKNWRIILAKENYPAITVSYFYNKKYKPTVYIPKDYMITKSRLRQMLRHEIFTHAIRQENALRQPLGIIGKPLGTANYVFDEEGLAIYNGKKNNNVHGSETLGMIALGFAKKYNFRKTYNNLRVLGLDENLAWNRTIRVFRGYHNTSQKGRYYPGDLIYFKGYQKIKKCLFKNPNIYNQLYYGKIKVEDIKFLEKFNLNKPSIVPK